jgi:hypothetical protein
MIIEASLGGKYDGLVTGIRHFFGFMTGFFAMS